MHTNSVLDALLIHAKRKLFCAFWRAFFSHESSMKINFYSQQFYTFSLSLYLSHTYFKNSNERYTWVLKYTKVLFQLMESYEIHAKKCFEYFCPETFSFSNIFCRSILSLRLRRIETLKTRIITHEI